MLFEIEILQKQAFNNQLAFCYLTCERLLPNYETFYKQHKWGDLKLLKKAVGVIYDNLLGKSLSDYAYLMNFANSVEAVTPDTEDFGDIWGSSALDACATVIETFEFMIDKSYDRLFTVSTLATDTVDMFVQEILNLRYTNDNSEMFELAISNHPLMQREINLQKQSINYLAQVRTITKVDVNHLLIHQEMNGNAI
jgi:uncharacterized protein YjaG (DUF416 family)